MFRSAAPFSMVGLAAGLSASALTAQADLRVDVAPFAAIADLPGTPHFVPLEDASDQRVDLDASRFVGLQLFVHSSRTPIELRLGWGQTLGGSLRAPDGFASASCGPNCTSTRALYRSVGRARVRMLWADARVAPFPHAWAPYLFGGLVREVTSYTPRTDLREHFATSQEDVRLRYGVGWELALFNAHAVWIEWAHHSSINDIVSIGLRLRLFRGT